MVEAEPLVPLPGGADGAARAARYGEVAARLALLLEGEADWVAAMATVACELHAAFAYYHWTGFYRAAAVQAGGAAAARLPGEPQLVVGPYQGGLGCLRIPFSKGVCGAAARTQRTQLVPDVHAFPGHIACASSTQVRGPACCWPGGACAAAPDNPA